MGGERGIDPSIRLCVGARKGARAAGYVSGPAQSPDQDYAAFAGRQHRKGGSQPGLRSRLLGVTRGNGGLFPRSPNGGATEIFAIKRNRKGRDRCMRPLRSGVLRLISLHCMSLLLAQTRPSDMSALTAAFGQKRTRYARDEFFAF